MILVVSQVSPPDCFVCFSDRSQASSIFSFLQNKYLAFFSLTLALCRRRETKKMAAKITSFEKAPLCWILLAALPKIAEKKKHEKIFNSWQRRTKDINTILKSFSLSLFFFCFFFEQRNSNYMLQIAVKPQKNREVLLRTRRLRGSNPCCQFCRFSISVRHILIT